MFPGRLNEIAVLRHGEPVIAQAIAALQRRAYVEEARRIGFSDLPPLKESPADIIGSAETFYGLIVGARLTALLATERRGEATLITRLCVDPGQARRGHATRLLRQLIDKGKDDLLVTTAEANAPALALYLKLGFTVLDRYRSPEGLDLVTLRLDRDGSTGERSQSHDR